MTAHIDSYQTAKSNINVLIVDVQNLFFSFLPFIYAVYICWKESVSRVQNPRTRHPTQTLVILIACDVMSRNAVVIVQGLSFSADLALHLQNSWQGIPHEAPCIS